MSESLALFYGAFGLFPIVVVGGVVLCGRHRRHAAVRWIASVLLWAAFDLSCLAMWGAFRFASTGERTMNAILAALLLAQPAIAIFCARLAHDRRG